MSLNSSTLVIGALSPEPGAGRVAGLLGRSARVAAVSFRPVAVRRGTSWTAIHAVMAEHTPVSELRSIAARRDEDAPDSVHNRATVGSVCIRMGVEQLALGFRSRRKLAGVPGVRRRIGRLDPVIPDERGRITIREPSGVVSTERIAIPALGLAWGVLHAYSLPVVHLNVTLR